MENYGITRIPFQITGSCNNQNYNLYVEYLRSAILRHSNTLGTTYKTYASNMKLFFDYLFKYEGNPYIIDQEFLLNFTDVWERYSFFCLELGNNKRTIANKRTACSAFFDWCMRKRKIPVNPFIFIEKIKVTEQDKRRKSYFLTTKEIWKIQHFLNEGEFIFKGTEGEKKIKFDLQDNLLFNMFLDTGARISEIHSIRLDQIDLDTGTVYDVKLKEGYIDNLFFFDETQKLLKKWLEYREENNIYSDYLFITNYKQRINQMSQETIRATVRKIGLIVGIEDFYPHSIRKTIINLTAQSDEQLASNFAHHSSLEVTRKHYVKKQNAYEIRNKMKIAREKVGI